MKSYYDQIKEALIAKGHKPEDVDAAIKLAQALDLEVPDLNERRYVVKNAKIVIGAKGSLRLGRITKKQYRKHRKRVRARLRRAHWLWKTTVKSSVNA